MQPMSHRPPAPSLHGSCHCGAVRLTLPVAPDKATSCNCSFCRRSGGIWAYYEFGTVSIQGHPENTERSEEHTSELQSLMRISYAVFCLKKKKYHSIKQNTSSSNITKTQHIIRY